MSEPQRAWFSMPFGMYGSYVGTFVAASDSLGIDDDTAQVLLSGHATPQQSDRAKCLMVNAARQLTCVPVLGHA